MEQNAARTAEKAAAISSTPPSIKDQLRADRAARTAPNVQRLVDIEQKKAEGKGRGYERWATMHNLKQMAATLNVYQEYGFTSPEQLEAAVDTAYQEMRQTSGELKALETKLQGKRELRQQVLAYANRGTCTSTHYVRVDFLEEVVLGEIRRLTKFASLYEDEFVKAVIGHSQQAEQTDRKLKEKELRTLLARDEELDGLFERIYEDNVSGKLSDDRFAKMSRRYEDEQKELAEKIKKLRSEIEKQSSRSMTTDMFIGLVRKYTRARKLTPRMLNELIEKIEVFNAEKIDGVWEQRLRIHYNCVGTIEIPTVLPLPIPEVSVNTRKGVVVNYAPCELAV